MAHSFFGSIEKAAAERLILWAFQEDLGERGDLTCQGMIDPTLVATVKIVSRQPGILAGLPIAQMIYQQMDASIQWEAFAVDGDELTAGQVVAEVTGPVSTLLTGERTVLNFVTHLSGIATLTHQFVELAQGTKAKILDTRKTLPGYRSLAKYAVRCGGGHNHRMGLYDGILIKDNHLAAWKSSGSIAEAIEHVRAQMGANIDIEVEVDTLEQMVDAMRAKPQIILLDNMTTRELTEAVAYRDQHAAEILLEASGGVNLTTVAAIAATGVDRISIGALTHSAPQLDLALDWGAALKK
ncbi:nicotinate-nucleotide pyrophosphorylase [Planctopirus limnophila DSM 3776]|uniref:Probable nicotinate-nucleotide pyrophosphorylase [carboxylating] n=1 Tax=Planctopirus limnophila (strain ATCC 43296 / DSM 3776 / IFAM 1008 / Mu 290) TaxID=521674 RepID=D5SNB9_PLAL2|nr:carboxylating nicotinate-nucleotide diphosphorylase [Planctopirus limnophila]ADG66046.1 nicotinate-nucleotide pyrophosphorylase [Planctopirus limnophila DSM 3776]